MKRLPEGASDVRLAKVGEYVPSLKGLHSSTLRQYARLGYINVKRKGVKLLYVDKEELNYLNRYGLHM